MHVWNTDFGSCNYTVTIAMENSNSSLYNKKTDESRMMLISVISFNYQSNGGGEIFLENLSTYWKIYYSRHI